MKVNPLQKTLDEFDDILNKLPINYDNIYFEVDKELKLIKDDIDSVTKDELIKLIKKQGNKVIEDINNNHSYISEDVSEIKDELTEFISNL